eukprot:CAMPEP_0183714692 /NCGR_PEP_ID=MMETSP0737-20130205/9144_1 /TAXON_ID=385413 /ORGANISM="Thalassiosira miniscula, Strain CCMP1093" /LENGTH=1608 /DNA_ID=CAMNT_0025943675 /DNA_START=54 /DNA_END=4880 /DNA_ORIENTATION=-
MTPRQTKSAGGGGGIQLAYENDNADLELQRRYLSKGYRTAPHLYVNGDPVPASLASQARPNQTLLDFLRTVLGLTGSKLGCGEGGCGACTVLVSRYESSSKSSSSSSSSKGRIVHSTVNACLFPVLAADGCHVTTIEGVGSWRKQYAGLTCDGSDATVSASSKEDHLHPIQRAMIDFHGSQCGYCTPGIIMALYGLFSSNDNTTEDGGGTKVAHLEEHLDGNLCRCTGYRPIWDAARSLCVDGAKVADMEDSGPTGPCGTPCRDCPERELCEMDCNVSDKDEEKKCGDGGGVVCSSTQSKVQDYQSVLASKYDEAWWTQADDMFPKELLPRQLENEDDLVNDKQQLQQQQPLMVVDNSIHNDGTWFQPRTLEELLDLFREFSISDGDNNNGGIKMVVGNTEVGIETKFKHAVFPRLIHPSPSIHTLYEIFCTDSHFVVGACSSLSDLQKLCHDYMVATVPAGPSAQSSSRQLTRTAQPMHDMLRWFASTQIRNVACLGGNLATASPISDMNPLLASLNATLVLTSRPSPDGALSRRHIPVSDFFVGYRKVQKTEMEVIERVDIPLLASRLEYCMPFKQARRREDDISIVTAGMRIKLAPNEDNTCWLIEDVGIAFGGMAPKTVLAKSTMTALLGKAFEEATFANARNVLQKEFAMPDDVPGGQSQYRLTLACSFLHQFWLYTAKELQRDVADMTEESTRECPPVPTIESTEDCEGFVGAPKPRIGGVQSYPAPKVAMGLEAKHLGHIDAGSKKEVPLAAAAAASNKSKQSQSKDSVGQPSTHASGPLHCTGEAAYADDIPAPPNTLHGSLILASKCHARLTSIDIAPALGVPGVVGAFTHKDIMKLGGDNQMGPIKLDDVAFLPLGDKVDFVGQVLGIVVGVSQEIAEKGARAVAVEYEELKGKAIVSIEEAIEAQSFWTDCIHEMRRGGNAEEILDQPTEITEVTVDGKKKKMVIVEGSMRSGGQEHFYLEPNSTLAIPSESATQLTIYASTQAPTKTQDFCARVTNTPAAKVVVRMKRMGGGFGGKETRSVFASVAAAVAAKMTNRPCRLTLNRDVDMMITGGRHAFLAKYKAGAIVDDEDKDEDGSRSVKLHALDVKLYNNGGCKFDLTGPVLDRALFHVDNCYLWPNFHSVGTPCKTSQPPHTAFRGFGGPQGMVVTEHIMDHLALACGISGDKLRRDNMYTLDDATPFGMRFGGEFTGKWHVPTMWDRLYTELDVPARRAAADEFNKKNKWTKRGVGFIPTKFGIAFTAKFMNQGGALVHLYTDGTVLVSHGGTEMGQGLHTKVCQVAAQAFNIPLDDVFVDDSSTDKVANTLPSAASMSTDLYGMATLDACQQILKRLQPIRNSLGPDATLKEIAKAAFFDRVDLSAHGFFAIDNDRCGYDWGKDAPEGYPSNLPENSWKGHPFNYFTQGVALAEVEINVLTGDHKTISADVLVDVGSSINPTIDIGQIEGAFIQGMGWSTIEEVVYADNDHTWIRPRAKVFTTGPGTYKIPAFNDVPEKFNIALLEDADNPFAVHSSKAIGEPPFFLGCSVFFAIKDAVASTRKEGLSKNNTAHNNSDEYFEFRMPATSERIRMACGDTISSECITASAGELAPFQPKGSF